MKLAPKKYGDIHRMEVKHETSYVDALKAVGELVDSTTTSNALRTHEETEKNKTIQ